MTFGERVYANWLRLIVRTCNPSECSFSYSGKNTVIYIVTVLIGLCGGLIKVLQALISRVVNFVRRKKRPKEEVRTLDTSRSSHFTISTAIDDMLKDMFIEQWNWNASFELYYSQCAPD
ncbi:unnamed protein product [Didymodactylos carnosus]|uniref:Uncharacterized protein n=1 Tax=Didymodactylos carnosus TaxID=1234261 RepID=A0A8S2QXR4_9BILA|nr:unnamed protein product [Didymodactylos carnosus]CAF4125707.1 unnamed protein product [Didymodactylos carnosus]